MAQKLFAQDIHHVTKGATEALGANLFVIENSTNTENVEVATAGENVLGVTEAAWALGDKAVSIAYAGVVYITLNATLAVGALVASDANGKAVAYAAGDYVAGRLMSGGVAGDLASLLLIRAPIDTIV